MNHADFELYSYLPSFALTVFQIVFKAQITLGKNRMINVEIENH